MPADAPGQAHGVRFAGPLPALAPGGEDLPACAVTPLGPAAVEREWGGTAAEVLAEHRATDGSALVRIERRNGDVRVWGVGHGVALVRDGGRSLLLATPEGPPWLRARMLVAHTLPLVATLRGREVLHASAVLLGGSVLALTAPSGTGKSSVALHLRAGGARFVSDDALALAVEDGRVLAFPGPRYANVPRHEAAALGADAREALGVSLGATDELHVAPAGTTSAGPLAAVVVLERADAGAPTHLRPDEDVARTLLAAAYLPYVRDPARLVRQLDVAAAVSHAVPVLRCSVRPGEPAAAVAARVRSWAARLEERHGG